MDIWPPMGMETPICVAVLKAQVPAITHFIRIDSETEMERALFAHHHHRILMQVMSAPPTYALCLL